MATLNEGAKEETLANTLRRAVTQTLRDRKGLRSDEKDQSLCKALSVLKEMKAAGRTWQEMADRVEREFGTTLEKDQLKALVR